MASTTKRKYSLPVDKEKADYVQRNFDAIASNYDRFNDLITFGMHRLWKRRVVKHAGISKEPGITALDLCSGTGDIALMLAAAAGENSRVIALDFSSEMLKVLRDRVSHQPPAGLFEIVQGDATDLSRFPSNTIHALTIGFGLRNVTDRAKSLQEMHRVLIPGGRAVILDVGQVGLPLIRELHSLFFNRIVPLIGFVLHGSAHEMYEYLPASASRYPSQSVLKAELEAAGFSTVSYQNLLFGSAAIHIAIK